MVKNLNVSDIALVELVRGEVGAPRDVFDTLMAAGLIAFSGGKPTLTAAGKTRAGKLKAAEPTLRAMFTGAATGNGRSMITTAAAPPLRG